MYSNNEKEIALTLLKTNGWNCRKAVEKLGYPSEGLLRLWASKQRGYRRRRSKSVQNVKQ